MNLILFDHRHNEYHLPRSDDRARHIQRVLRAEIGDTIRVGVVGGSRGVAVLTEATGAGITVRVEWENDSSEVLPVVVIIGHPRPPVLQRLIRDLTAMRVGEIHVCVGVLSEASYLDSSLWGRTDQVIREGLSQGMHTAPPALRRWRTLSAALDGVVLGPTAYRPAVPRVYGAVSGSARTLPDMLAEVRSPTSSGGVVIAIGPERGFTAEEETLLIDRGFSGVHLGSSTLRTETATIVLAGAMCAALS